MPRLVLFAACQKAIINEQDESLSLIALMENVSIPVPEGTQVPSDASAPLRWDVVSYWNAEPTDAGKQFEQRTYLELPDGSTKIDTRIKFHLDNKTARNMINVTGFPVGQKGECILKLWLKDLESNEDRLQAEYILHVVHERALPTEIINGGTQNDEESTGNPD